jgi:hypothetical protein
MSQEEIDKIDKLFQQEKDKHLGNLSRDMRAYEEE